MLSAFCDGMPGAAVATGLVYQVNLTLCCQYMLSCWSCLGSMLTVTCAQSVSRWQQLAEQAGHVLPDSCQAWWQDEK